MATISSLAAFALPHPLDLGVAALALLIPGATKRATPACVLAAIALAALARELPAAWLASEAIAGLGLRLGAPAIGVSVLLSRGTAALACALLLAPAVAAGGLLAQLLLAFIGIFAAYWGAQLRFDETAVLIAVVIYKLLSWSAAILTLGAVERGNLARRLDWAYSLAGGLGITAAVATWPIGVNGAAGSRITFLWPQGEKEEFKTAAAGLGFHNAGLYGEWPRVLARAGYQVERAESLEAAILARTDVLILPSAFRDWHPGELQETARWIESGGHAVIVGEHSDLEGCARRLNPLLEGFGIFLNFDTTSGLLGDGLRGVITAGEVGKLLDRNPALPYNRGGSLSIHRGSRPALIGEWWHADQGDALAPERAFLSDYRLTRDDRVGDVMLMATAAGNRVLVAGDSTPFLNQNTLYSSSFLIALPATLLHRSMSDLRYVGALILGLATGFVVRARVRSLRPLVVLTAIAAFAGRPSTTLAIGGTTRFGVVSTAEGNAIERDPFSPRSATALGLALSRADLTPFLGDWKSLTARPTVVAILNPSRALHDRELRKLESWAREGSIVVIAGPGDSAAFRSTATALGVSVSNHPVGNLRGSTFTTYEAWRVDSLPASATPLEASGFLVGGLLPYQHGGIVVMADGWFFLSKNLELENAFDERNSAWVRDLIAARR